MTQPNGEFWRGRRVLITGHTGFKGGWLALWLTRMGAVVTGYALAPEFGDGIYGASGLTALITPVTADIRHASVLRECMHLMRPEIVFHLAAQSLVRRAHQDPVETYDVNVVGTVKVMEEIRRCRSVRAAVIVTSDKVYKNDNRGRAFIETDVLGGDEPYGASKAAAEFAVAAFRKSLSAASRLKVATARAGNVFGGGDWAEDRLVPDAMRAFASGLPLILRNSGSTRPWQYVLDPLCGYLLLAERLFAGDDDAASAWNFGPDEAAGTAVSEVADLLVDCWNDTGWGVGEASWESTQEKAAPYEARVLGVDSTKAQQHLAWRPRMSLEDGLAATVAWHQAQLDGADMPTAAAEALDTYLAP